MIFRNFYFVAAGLSTFFFFCYFMMKMGRLEETVYQMSKEMKGTMQGLMNNQEFDRRMRRKWDTTMCKEYFSQSKEDEILYDLFFSQATPSEGFFLEMGALDGVRFSNTLWYERCLGWNGMLLEPNPNNYKRLVENRKKTLNLETAACKEVGFIEMTLEGDAVAHVPNGNLKENFEKSFFEKGLGKLVKVPCEPLSQIFGKHNISKIDLFSLDVEGQEAAVLETIDFSKVKIDVMVVENDAFMTQENLVKRVREIMQQNGFLLITGKIERSDIFVHSGYLRRTKIKI